VDRLGIPGFLVGRGNRCRACRLLRAPVGRTARRKMLIALKSGNFGGPEFFSDCAQVDALITARVHFRGDGLSHTVV